MSKEKSLYEDALKAERNGDHQTALKLYKESARCNPSFRPPFMNLGALYSRAARPDLAIGFFAHARKLEEDAAVLFNLGSEHFRLDQYDESRKLLTSALKIDSRLLKAHILLAYLYGKLQRHDRAEIYFNNALKIDKQNRMALIGLAVSLSEQEKFEESLKVSEAVLAIHPKDTVAENLRAGLLLKLGRINDSFKEYSNLVQNSQKFTNFTDHLNAARESGEGEYSKTFVDINRKIKTRTDELKKKIEARKKILASSTKENRPVAEEELKEELQDMVDLSLLHLFNGDPDKALRFLFQAKKRKEEQGG